jgi:hypothetical protein
MSVGSIPKDANRPGRRFLIESFPATRWAEREPRASLANAVTMLPVDPATWTLLAMAIDDRRCG